MEAGQFEGLFFTSFLFWSYSKLGGYDLVFTGQATRECVPSHIQPLALPEFSVNTHAQKGDRERYRLREHPAKHVPPGLFVREERNGLNQPKQTGLGAKQKLKSVAKFKICTLSSNW